MTQIAHCRTFNGTSAFITLAATDYNTAIGDLSWVALCRTNASGFRWIISLAGGTGGEWALGQNAGGTATALWFEPTTQNPSGANFDFDNEWYLVAITKADGSSTPNYRTYRYSTTTWSHQAGGSIAETGAPSGATLRIGSYNGSSEFWSGDIACVAVYPSVLSQANVEGMTADLASWTSLSPTGLWLLNQTSVAESLLDSVGNGDQTAITGTTVTAISDLPFDVGGVEKYSYYVPRRMSVRR